jgi:peptidoglycan-associated lipoprotein
MEVDVITLAMALLATGCKHSTPTSMANTTLQSPTGGYRADPAAQAAAVAEMLDNFGRVHFETARAVLSADAMDALTANALILSRFPDLVVEIQGHADERGTTDYNLALGQQRAAAVADYLIGQGIAASRLPLVSFGEERPIVAGSGDVAWAQNRRAEFRILTGGLGIQGTVN